MFDTDGNGNLDLEEFEHVNLILDLIISKLPENVYIFKLQTIIRNQTSLGQRHRDTRMTGSVIKENSCLNEFFFGKDLDQLLTSQKFTDFQRKLQTEVIRMEVRF